FAHDQPGHTARRRDPEGEREPGQPLPPRKSAGLPSLRDKAVAAFILARRFGFGLRTLVGDILLDAKTHHSLDRTILQPHLVDGAVAARNETLTRCANRDSVKRPLDAFN